MIKHQTMWMHLPARFEAPYAQCCQEPLPILVIPEDRLAPVSPVHQVINGARIFHS